MISARHGMNGELDSNSGQWCVLEDGGRTFCLPAAQVAEVTAWPVVTRVPLAPALLLGVFAHRDQAVPLVSAARAGAEAVTASWTKVVVARVPSEMAPHSLIGLAAANVRVTQNAAGTALDLGEMVSAVRAATS